VLIVGGAMSPMYEPAIARGLAKLGHRVETIDASPGRRRTLLARVEDRLLFGPGLRELRRTVVERARELQPDFILVYQGHALDRGTIEKLGKVGFVAGVHNDDPFGARSTLLRYRHLLPALPAYDSFHVYRSVNVPEARALGVPRVSVLMPYFIPWLDHPRELTREEQESWDADVVFVGHHEPDQRVACLARAARHGYKTRVYGPTRFWQRALPADVRRMVGEVRPLGAEDYRKALAGSKVCTCFFSKWNRDQYTRRAFEIPAAGRFLLSERTEFMATFFREDEEVALFDNEDEFLDKLNFYLSNQKAREQVARAGREKVVRAGCDVRSRVDQLMSELHEWRSEKLLAWPASSGSPESLTA
jgi:hypothetical protein